jgi:hypothetical protein
MTPADLATQRRALRQGALLLSAPQLGTIAVRGGDRQTWLNGMVTCDVAKIAPGGGAYGFAVAKNGKLLAELRVLFEGERILLGAPRERLDMLREHFERYIIMEDAELSDASDEVAWLLAHGGAAADLVPVAREAGALAAATVDTTGLGGAAIALPHDVVGAAIERLCRNDRALVALGTDEAWDTLRVEIGLPRWGVDFDDQNYPQEAGLERLGVSFQKGCYLGQEAVFMLQNRGHVKKKLVPLAIEGTAELTAGAEITSSEGGAVGQVTSWVPSTDTAELLALGYVKYKQANPGNTLSVGGRSARVLGKPED